MRVFIPAFLIVLAAMLHSLSSAEAQLTDVDCVAIVDSVGTKVGRVHTASAGTSFYIGHNGFAVPLWLNNNAFTGFSGNIYFTDANCSSTPFVKSFLSTFAGPTSTVVGQEVYYSEPAAVPQSIQALSYRFSPDLSCQPIIASINGAPAIGQFTLPPYTPPFLIEPEACFTPAPGVAALTPYGLGAMALVLAFGAYMMRRGHLAQAEMD